MERQKLIDEIDGIIRENYQDIAVGKIADLIAKIKVGHQIRQEALKAEFKGYLDRIVLFNISNELRSVLESKIKELEN